MYCWLRRHKLFCVHRVGTPGWQAACSSTGADAGGSADRSAGGSKRGSPRSPGGGSPGGAAGALRAFLGRRASGEHSGGLKRSASSGNQQPVCLHLLRNAHG